MGKIFIIEGPAGAGKTTLIHKILDEYNGAVEITKPSEQLGIPLERPRDYGKQLNSSGFALTKDIAHLLSAFHLLEHERLPLVLIDRCLFSAIIYEGIRAQRATDHIWPSFLKYSLNFIEDMLVQYALYSRFSVSPSMIEIVLVVPLPYEYVLINRRRDSSRNYPFSLYEEYRRYEELVNNLPLKLDSPRSLIQFRMYRGSEWVEKGNISSPLSAELMTT